jgi:uncharacterized protein
MDALFRPDGEWQRLPAKAVTSHQVNSLLLNLGLSLAVVAAVWFLSDATLWLVLLACAAVTAWTIWRVIRIGRWIRSFGFREGERDLLITHGLWFKSLTAIPYGRMLSVEVTTGPVARLWGLATVELITASHRSNAQIPALGATEAARLRDQLIALGEAQALPL